MNARSCIRQFLHYSFQVWFVLHTTCQYAQNIPAFNFTSYTTAQGLPASEVITMAEDVQGFLWMATRDGLSRFDGQYFRNYRMSVIDSTLLSATNQIEQVHCVRDEVWCLNQIGYFYRLDRVSDTFTFTGIFIPQVAKWGKKTTDRLINFVVDPARHCLWVKEPEGVFRYEMGTGAKKQVLTVADTRAGYMELDPDGNLWCCGEQGITFFDPDTGDKKRFFESSQFYEMRYQYDGKIWAASSIDTFYYVDVRNKATGWVKTNADEYFGDLKPDCAGSIQFVPGITGDSILWIGTCSSGILLLQIHTGQFVAQFNSDSYEKKGILQNWINFLFTTKNQTLWLAGQKGVAKVDGRQLNFQTQHIPYLKKEQVSRVRQVLTRFRHPEQEWIATADMLLLFDKASQSVVKSFLPNDTRANGGHNWGKVNYIQYDETGNLWVATNTGIVRIDQNFHTETYELGTNGIVELISDGYNGIWLRHHSGAGLFNTVSKTYTPIRFPKNEKDADKPVFKLTSGIGNAALFCSDSVILRVRRNDYDITCRCFPKPELVLKTIHPVDVVETDTSFWVVHPSGLTEYLKTSSRIRHFGTAEGLSNVRIRSMLPGPEGQLWMNSDNGIFAFYPQYGRFKRYAEEDGLAESFVPGILTRDGDVLHAGFSYAYSTWNPGSNLVKTNVKPCITDVFALDERVPVDLFANTKPSITVRHAQNILRFEFTCPDFYQSEKITFRFQLEGFDAVPRNAGTSRSAVYTNLDGGHYTFRVWAINADGFLCEDPAVVRLRVIPPYYRTWWFYLLCVTAIGGIFYAIFRYREIQRIRQTELRHRIARDLHDEVGSTLSAISILSQTSMPGNSRALDNIGDKARAALDSMSDIVWAVNPQNDAMDQVIGRMAGFASEILEGAGIMPHFTIGEGVEKMSLPLEIRKNFYLIFKEAVTNCARHSKAEHAYISLEKEEGNLVFELSDDGIGLQESTAAYSSGGNGLKNMAARAHLIGAVFRTSQKPEGGFSLLLIIPL